MTAGGLPCRAIREQDIIERRGLGLVAVAWRERAIVAGVAILGDDAAPPAIPLQNLATIRLVGVLETASIQAVLDWWPYPDTEATQRRDEAGSEAFRS